MSDYYHYAYQCPYISGTTENRIYCEGNCRIQFSAIADCREYLQQYCANDDQHWKDCTIAIAKTRRIEKNIKLKQEIKKWQTTTKKK